MSRKKIATDDVEISPQTPDPTTQVIEEATKAANDPSLTPPETQGINELATPAIDTTQTESTQQNDYLQSLRDELNKIRDARIIIKNKDKNLAALEKELQEQYYDALLSEKIQYKKIVQEVLQF